MPCKPLNIADAIHKLGALAEDSFDLSNLGINSENISKICFAFLKNSHIKSLDLSNNVLSPTALEALAKALNDASNIKELKLSNCNINLAGAKKIAACKHIEKINLSNNNCSAYGARDLSSSNIPALNLANNNIGNIGAQFILGNLQSQKSAIVEVNLENNNIDEELIKNIQEEIARNAEDRKLAAGGPSFDVKSQAGKSLERRLDRAL